MCSNTDKELLKKAFEEALGENHLEETLEILEILREVRNKYESNKSNKTNNSISDK